MSIPRLCKSEASARGCTARLEARERERERDLLACIYTNIKLYIHTNACIVAYHTIRFILVLNIFLFCFCLSKNQLSGNLVVYLFRRACILSISLMISTFSDHTTGGHIFLSSVAFSAHLDVNDGGWHTSIRIPACL